MAEGGRGAFGSLSESYENIVATLEEKRVPSFSFSRRLPAQTRFSAERRASQAFWNHFIAKENPENQGCRERQDYGSGRRCCCAELQRRPQPGQNHGRLGGSALRLDRNN